MGKQKEYKKNEQVKVLAIDSHCHLDQLEDRDLCLTNLKADGIQKIVSIVGDNKSIKQVQEIIKSYPNVYYMAGVHPYFLEDLTPDFVEDIKNLRKKDNHLVGIGEIGLDYKYINSEEEKGFQREKFIFQLKLAHDLSLPVSIHVRDEYAEALKILKEHKNYLTHGGIIHCCMADETLVKEFVSLGFYISFSGVVTFVDLDASILATPIERMLIETDAPYLCPKPYRGRKNEPKYVLVTAEKIASVINKDVNEVIKITAQNTKNILKI